MEKSNYISQRFFAKEIRKVSATVAREVALTLRSYFNSSFRMREKNTVNNLTKCHLNDIKNSINYSEKMSPTVTGNRL